ncbi:HNH endonuclease signature motif containing protein [Actinomadura chokoriensis]|uniref:HNH endonuclease signature motif containing protein n=1 Tax=Actinomadura chokoriensis TaxID=454156 RepID=UPI0031F7D09C
MADLTDAELLQVAAAARRQTSWAQARELAAIAELTERRTRAEADGSPDYRTLPARESVADELAAALTVTGNTAATLVHLAERLTGPLSETGAALESGHLDFAKARVISDLTDQLAEPVARRVEAAALPKAPAQTTGQLRRAIKRILQRLAPEAIEERKREAIQQRRLEIWDTPSGTTDLGLCDLPTEDAHAIFNKITAAAQGIRHEGDSRPLNMIRADLATQLLHGHPLPASISNLLTPSSEATPLTPTREHERATACLPPDPSGNTLPGQAAAPHPSLGLPGLADVPEIRVGGQLAGAGIDAAVRAAPPPGGHAGIPGSSPVASRPNGQTTRVLSGRVKDRVARPPNEQSRTSGLEPDTSPHLHPGIAVEARHPRLLVAPEVQVAGYMAAPGTAEGTGRTRIDADWAADLVGRRLAHLSARTTTRDLVIAVPRTVRRIHQELSEARETACRGGDETHGRPGYRPPAALRREIEHRHPTCVFPTCNQPSHRCDLDHTVPWRPGITCRCNLAPLCRRHHRLKQSPGWTLHQIWPGLLIWTTPSGGWYMVRPDLD